MASLTYKMALNKGSGTPDFSKMSVDADGDGHLDDDYVPAAPGIDLGVARFSKTPKSTTTDCFRAIVEDQPSKDGRLHNKFMPGYGGFIPTEMTIKTEGGQWCAPKFLEVEAKEGDTPFENLGANQPPGEGAPPRSVVFSRDGVFVEGGPAMRKAGTNLI